MEQWSKPTPLPTNSDTSLPYLVAASGGNAGLAAASAARIIGLPCTIFVPAAQANIRHVFERYNTRGNIEVQVGGENYYQAYLKAQEMVKELGPKACVDFASSIHRSFSNCCFIQFFLHYRYP